MWAHYFHLAWIGSLWAHTTSHQKIYKFLLSHFPWCKNEQGIQVWTAWSLHCKIPNHLYVYWFYHLDQSEFSQKTNPFSLFMVLMTGKKIWPLQMRGELERQESGRDMSRPKKQSVTYLPENLQQECQRGPTVHSHWSQMKREVSGISGRPCFSSIHIYDVQLNTFRLDWGHCWSPGQHLGKWAECIAKENEDVCGWPDTLHLSPCLLTLTLWNL